MKISNTSWHYRLWNYICDMQTFRVTSHWFTDSVPRSLCPYVDLLLVYFLVQVPLLIFGGYMAAAPLVLGPLQWFATGNFMPEFEISIFDALSFALWFIYCIVGGTLLGGFVLFKGAELCSDNVAPTFKDAVTKLRETSTVSLAVSYFDAVHSKICPSITIVDGRKKDKQ